MTRRRAIVSLVCVLFGMDTGSKSRAQTTTPAILTPPSGPIPSTYFGMHNHQPTDPNRLVSIPIGTLRLWDCDVNWPNLEPAPGEWNWSRLDSIVAIAAQHQWQVILPLAFSPAWASARPSENRFNDPTRLGWSAEPRNIQDWRDYVRAVALRYQGRIHVYEIWNEPNNSNFYSGGIPKLVQLAQEAYAILKQVDPTVTVISPAAADNEGTGAQWLAKYFAQGGGAYSDVIGYHFYIGAEPPENLPAHIRVVEQVQHQFGFDAKPLWNTEAGWARDSITFSSPSNAAAWLARAYIFNWAAGVTQFNWYAWDNRVFSSLYLVEADLKTPTPAAIAYAQMKTWLVGARMLSIAADSAGNWTCALAMPDGTAAYLLWNPDRSASIALPASWNAIEVRDLTGARRPAPPSLLIGEMPLLVRTASPGGPTRSASVVSAASYTAPVAPGSLVTIEGDRLVSVLVRDSAGAARNAQMFYAGPTQINFQIPPETALGSANLIAIGGETAQALVDVAPVAPGIFTANSDGQGAPAAFVVFAKISQAAFACAGDPPICQPQAIDLTDSSGVLTLYGTGVRGRSSLAGVAARYCGRDLTVLYAGAQPTYTGLDQINLLLPNSLAGCGLGPLTLTVDGQAANPVQLLIK